MSADDHLPDTKTVKVELSRTDIPRSPNKQLWEVIKNRTAAIRFDRFEAFVDSVLCHDDDDGDSGKASLAARASVRDAYNKFGPRHFTDRVRSYDQLKQAAEMFLMVEAGIALTPNSPLEVFQSKLEDKLDVDDLERLGSDDFDMDEMRDGYLATLNADYQALPYTAQIIRKLATLPLKSSDIVGSPLNYGILRDQATGPIMVELLWNYWMEQGMLHQAMQALTLRFQNRGAHGHEALANLEIDPLRGVSNLLWGYIQDEGNRLSVQRRAYEYLHEYGLQLTGRAVPQLMPADNRPEFLRAFHDLLSTALAFYQADDDTTVQSDGFPVVNALRNLHLILAEGAHNQYGDLPWTARVEMLIQQWILARPEMFMFLHGRVMVPYPEAWMDRVDVIRQTLGWGTTSITHFRDLAIFGEQVLLSVRWDAWSVIHDGDSGADWARTWRTQIQTYAHAYKAVTGVDLGLPTTMIEARADRYIQPAVYLERAVRRRDEVAPGGGAAALGAGPIGRSRTARGRAGVGRVLPPGEQ